MKVTVEELAADGIANKLIASELDVGIAYQPADALQLWFEPLYTEEMVLVVAASHPFAGASACAWWSCTSRAW